MLTGNIEEIKHESTEETPTFGVVADGRTYPAVVARRRQQNGSKRSTLYTISKNGRFSHLYHDAEANIIKPYFERRRERTNRGGITGNSATVPVGGGADKEGNGNREQSHPFRI